MYRKILFFGTILFFSSTMILAFQNCSSLSKKAPVAVNNENSRSKITILNHEGKEASQFKTGEMAHFVFDNVIAVCVDQPGQESQCVGKGGEPQMSQFSEITEEGVEGRVEKDVEIMYPGKMVIYGFTNDPVYPVISTSVQILEASAHKPASVE